MKKIIIAITVLALLPIWAQAESINCRVVGVSDGDTLTCLTNQRQSIKTRLHGIDAPESKQAFGTQSKISLSNLVYGKDVVLNVKDRDKYGRTVADVLINGKSANLAQVENGMAWAYRQYLKGDDALVYVAAETRAKSAKRGLWVDLSPIAPSEFRHKKKIPQLIPKNQNSSGFSCAKRTCSQMTSCEEARYSMTVCGVSTLDGDHDGVPCEKICRNLIK